MDWLTQDLPCPFIFGVGHLTSWLGKYKTICVAVGVVLTFLESMYYFQGLDLFVIDSALQKRCGGTGYSWASVGFLDGVIVDLFSLVLS